MKKFTTILNIIAIIGYLILGVRSLINNEISILLLIALLLGISVSYLVEDIKHKKKK